MQLFLISPGSGLTLNSLSFAFLGLSLVVLTVKWKNFVMFHISSKSLQLQYVNSGILENNISCIEAPLFFIIAIVICTQKKTSISFSFATICLTVCWVYWGIFILYYCHCHLYTKNDLNFFFICYNLFNSLLCALRHLYSLLLPLSSVHQKRLKFLFHLL